jgi:hypothetical protein
MVVHDYLQIHFDDGSIFNIYNPYEAEESDINRLGKCAITSVEIDPKFMRLSFSQGQPIKIWLRDKDYNGPEALEYIDSDGTRLIWP